MGRSEGVDVVGIVDHELENLEVGQAFKGLGDGGIEGGKVVRFEGFRWAIFRLY